MNADSGHNFDQAEGLGAAAPLAISVAHQSDSGTLRADFRPWPMGPGFDREAGVEAVDLEMIIPVFNEEDRLPATLDHLISYLRHVPWTTRLIVVDNGCVDATADVVDRMEAGKVCVDFVGCRDRGKGAAIRAGVARTSARWVGYCDADTSTPLDTIGEAVHQLERGFEVVMASRRCTGGRYLVRQPVGRRVASRLFHLAVGPLIGPVADTQCGLKLFDGAAARALFAGSELSGFSFDVEIVARAHRSGLRMIELPVDWSDQTGSSLNIRRECISVAREILRVHRSLHDDRRRLSEW